MKKLSMIMLAALFLTGLTNCKQIKKKKVKRKKPQLTKKLWLN